VKREFSLYLDLVRLFASLLVVLYHSTSVYNPGNVLFALGHEAVVIFFVLSGYVIAFVAETKEKTLTEYSVSRISRIYSVAIPAIVITMLADQIGFSLNQEAYPSGYQAWDYPAIRVVGSLFFLNEFWHLSIQTFSNVPYWSLNYEVWYYISFAVLTYISGRKKWLLFAAIVLLLGPKILLLMPIWWLGVYLYRAQKLTELSSKAAMAILLFSLAGLVAFVQYNVSGWGWDLSKQIVGPDNHELLAFSRYFISDYILALLVAAHFVAIRVLAAELFGWLNHAKRPIRYFSSFTFAIYLFHQPLLLLFEALLVTGDAALLDYGVVMSCTLLSIWAIGHFTERKRPFYKRICLSVIESPHWLRAVGRFLRSSNQVQNEK
jgi:peptidoglycan/LPS O-acetylase OafA/YrhL